MAGAVTVITRNRDQCCAGRFIRNVAGCRWLVVGCVGKFHISDHDQETSARWSEELEQPGYRADMIRRFVRLCRKKKWRKEVGGCGVG